MNAEDFKKLEAELGHPPTAKEVREHQPRFKTAYVQFKDASYNYRTSVNGKQTDEQIIKYFKGQTFNLGSVEDDLHICIDCTVEPSKI
jgi:hypothetical protein